MLHAVRTTINAAAIGAKVVLPYSITGGQDGIAGHCTGMYILIKCFNFGSILAVTCNDTEKAILRGLFIMYVAKLCSCNIFIHISILSASAISFRKADPILTIFTSIGRFGGYFSI